eukprot:GAHX01003077.1.p1 GENE.GAHX01003077.1~~GAHX01003077.1.p1  ORF type:complete len:265 (+),score=55.18 GAHX01003077.1:46-840(+)
MDFCSFCGLDLLTLPSNEQNEHINNCINNLHHHPSFLNTQDNSFISPPENTIIKKQFITCIICERNLSTLSVFDRKQHMRDCSERFPGVDKEVLREVIGDTPTKTEETKAPMFKTQKLTELEDNEFYKNIPYSKIKTKDIFKRVKNLYPKLIGEQKDLKIINEKINNLPVNDLKLLKYKIEKLDEYNKYVFLISEKKKWLENNLKNNIVDILEDGKYKENYILKQEKNNENFKSNINEIENNFISDENKEDNDKDFIFDVYNIL